MASHIIGSSSPHVLTIAPDHVVAGRRGERLRFRISGDLTACHSMHVSVADANNTNDFATTMTSLWSCRSANETDVEVTLPQLWAGRKSVTATFFGTGRHGDSMAQRAASVRLDVLEPSEIGDFALM